MGEGPQESYAMLQQCFGSAFERTRLDLAEQRIVLDPTGDEPRPSKDHVILGFALHLARVAAKHANAEIRDIADALRRELEPLLAHDYLTESLFVALQLSAFLDRARVALSSHARAALLLTWAASQNSQTDHQRFTFWARHDREAYLDFVEELFVEPVSQTWSEQIIAPLKDIWRGNVDVVLEQRTKRWVTLVWRSHELPATPVLEHEGHRLPIARTAHQLVLSNVALAILSENPLTALLPALALAKATDRLSTERHHWQHPTTEREQSQDIPCKDIINNLGPVLRWRFTEKAKPHIEALRDKTSDVVLRRGFESMLRSFDRFGWNWGGTTPQHLRDQQPLFAGTAEENRSRFVDCPELAARDELPSLRSDDEAIIAEKLEEAFNSPQLRESRSYTSAAMDVDHYLGWFAKLRPARLAEIGSTFRLRALANREPWLALDLANDLPYAPEVVSPAELLQAAIALVERRSASSTKRFDHSILEAHVLALTCFGSAELKEWLLYAARNERARANIHMYQIHVLSRYLLPDDLATFAREQARQCCDEEPDESDISASLFDYWAVLGGTSGPPDAEFHEWVDSNIRTRHLAGHRRFYWRLLWFRTAPDEVLREAMSDGAILGLLGNDGLRASVYANRPIQDWTALTRDFERLIASMPLDDVGTVLVAAGQLENLSRWGHLMFDQALPSVGEPPFERSFWGKTIYERDAFGGSAGSSCDRERPASTETTEALRPAAKTNLRDFAAQFSIEERDRKVNEALQIWRNDWENLRRHDDGAFSQFGAFRALEVWRDQHPAEFLSRTAKLLEKAAAKPGEAFHLGGFIAAVLDAMVTLDADLAVQFDEQLRDSALRVDVINDYGERTFVATLWRCAAAGSESATRILRRELDACTDEEQLARHAITALAEGGEATLQRLCLELLAKPLAKDRCLAVSVMAWMPSDWAIQRLQALAQSDESGWVRRHSAWAAEVAQHEQSIRTHYQRTLRMIDRNAVIARLQTMLPGLTLSARSWHRDLEERELKDRDIPRATEAALAAFWYNFRHRSSSAGPEIFGRKSREYLRGECLRDLREPKPRLI